MDGLLLWRSISVKKGLKSVTGLPRKGRRCGEQTFCSCFYDHMFESPGCFWPLSIIHNETHLGEPQIKQFRKPCRHIQRSGRTCCFNLSRDKFQLGSPILNYTKSIRDTLKENGMGKKSLWTWRTKNVTTVFHWVTTWIDSYNSRVYFWVINLPGEMQSRIFSTNIYSPAIKILYITKNNFQIGYRIRAAYKTRDLRDVPKIESGLVFDIYL